MKKNVIKKWFAMTLALAMAFSHSGFAVLAAEEPAEAEVIGAAVVSEEFSEEEDGAGPADDSAEEAASESDEAVIGNADEEADGEAEAEETEDVESEADEVVEADNAEFADVEEMDRETTEAEGPEVIEETAENATAGEAGLAAEPVIITASSIEIAGKAYVFADVSGAPEGAEVKITIDGEEHAVTDFTAIGDTGIVYYSAEPLSGTLYGIDPGEVTSYTDFYSSKGVSASGADYDVITSATCFSGFHAKDIPSIVARNESGIVGVMLGDIEIEAKDYVEAFLLKEAGKELTLEQTALLAVTLNTDPSADPATTVKAVKVGSASYGYSCRYGDGEFIINPDDTVEGFVWSDYKNALYAAVISDGTNSAGAVWWIDLYGESATSGPHYNKVEIAINNGTSKGSNQAEVGRYAAMYNSEKQELKAGTYTVTLYAKGYETVSAQIEVLSSFDGEVTAAISADKASVELTGVDSFENPKATVSRTEGTGRQAKTFYYAQNADVVDGKVALDTTENELVPATYTVTVNSDNYAPVTTSFDYDDSQQAQAIIAEAAPEKVAVGRTTKINVTGAEGALSFESSDESIATVTADGTVKGKAVGTVTIKVTAAATEAYSEGKAEATVRVVPGKTSRGDMFNLANNVKVTWNAVPGAKYYKVYRSGVEEPVIVTTGLVGWDKAPGLENGKKYTYTVVASSTGKGDDSGDSTLSYSKVMYRLKTVVIRSVKNTDAGKVTVKYDKSTAGDSYVLQYADNPDMKSAKTIVIQGGNTTTKVIGGLKKGKTYYIQIRVRKKVDGIDYYTTFGVQKKIKITK